MELTHNVQTVRQLAREIRERKYVVPDIQRPFVWNMDRVKKLVDSIIANIPIGGLVVWAAAPKESVSIKETTSALPGYDPKNSVKLFVIDGQQRMSVIYRLFEGGEYHPEFRRKILFDSVALHPSTKSVVATTRPLMGHVFLKDLLGEHYASFVRRFSSRSDREWLRKVRRQILAFKIPVTVVSKANLDEVRDVFLRINTLGRRVTEADAAFTKASRLNLKSVVSGFLRSLEHGYDELPSRQIQAVLALQHGASRIDSREIQRVIKELDEQFVVGGQLKPAFQKSWNTTTISMYNAIQFLKSAVGVSHYSYLPSDLIFTILSHFCHLNGNRKPSRHQTIELKKWFWSTSFCSRYTGRGYFDNVRYDIDFMQRLAAGGRNGNVRFSLKEKVPMSTVKKADYRQGTSLTKAFFVLLSRQTPMAFTDQYEVVTSGLGPSFARAQKHHVFPRAYLSKHEVVKSMRDRLLNMCFLPALDNQQVSSRAPMDYFGDLKRNSHGGFTKIMRSHLLPFSPDSSVWSKGNVKTVYAQFLNERLVLLESALRKEAGFAIIDMKE